jgi:hypothetical protein
MAESWELALEASKQKVEAEAQREKANEQLLRATAEEALAKKRAEEAEEKAAAEKAKQALLDFVSEARIVAPTPLLITLCGGTGAMGRTAERDVAVCRSLGQLLARLTSREVHLTTGGTGGLPLYVTDAFLEASDEKQLPERLLRVHHILPFGAVPQLGMRGKLIRKGQDMEERRTLLVQQPADAVVIIQGGPGSMDEMAKAKVAKQHLVPFIGSGGAAAGMFGATDCIPELNPKYNDHKHWVNVRNDDPAAHPLVIAKSLLALITKEYD